jgi:hypothetical protein
MVGFGGAFVSRAFLKGVIMQDQNIPTTATRPNYNELKQTTFGLNTAADQTMGRLFPDDAENPSLKALKSLVMTYMSRSRMVPNTWSAMRGVEDAINHDPKLANAALVRTLTNTAMHDGEVGTFASGRVAAQETLTTIVEKRPDLANAALVRNVTQIATHDPDSEVRLNAQRTLSQIAEKRPDLVDADMVKAVRNTATAPVVDHGQRRGDDVPWVRAGKLYGHQLDEYDNEARETARDTLKAIASKRPDLMAAIEPTIAKPLNVKQTASESPHAAPAAPRPTLMTP